MINCFNLVISFRSTLMLTGFLFFALSCQKMPTHTPEQLLFSMEKTSCMGKCPVYTLKVYQDGWAELLGTAHIKYLGNYQVKLSDEELEDIKNSFQKHQFFGLEEKYYANVSDLPTTYLFYQDGTNSKKVMDYHGAPENLKQLEKHLATYLDKDWKKSAN